MRIVFIGSSHFGLLCLKKILSIECCQVVGLVTAPKTFTISYCPEGVTNVSHADIYSYSTSRNLPCITLKQGMKDPSLLEQVTAWKPDIFVVVGWYHMLPKKWRILAPAYGFHASLLPDYSGGAPLVWSIINGEKKTGITLFRFSDGIDNGPIVAQEPVLIKSEDTIATLYQRIETVGLKILEENLPFIASNSHVLKYQDESKRRLFPQRKPEDGKINWYLSAKNIYDFIRAQTKPYPGAFSLFRSKKLTIWDGSIHEKSQSILLPGEIRLRHGSVIVGSGEGGSLSLGSVSQNENEIDAFSWFLQMNIQKGEKFM